MKVVYHKLRGFQDVLQYKYNPILKEETMERTDAEKVFALIADIEGDIRGRIVSERWWLIWIVNRRSGGQRPATETYIW